jgi:hypothetical protein
MRHHPYPATVTKRTKLAVEPSASSVIAKTFFLAKKIHRISASSLHRKNSLREIAGDNWSIVRISGGAAGGGGPNRA